ncbi:glycosyltransferase family 4 protein [Methylocystis heyeri]|uniref:Glycosyltransferase n=1 Tax=Methylocystis heyeri TaxID=391905 RepID=A0A6B8KC52_9HYPH|nr:glycosyltransferase family 4 protein [Methylocystis heyeri]QGM45994.1 glycosyltransferase [Methylocystis heyeri]
MKIAQIPPLMESVPPMLYGGTERIVSYLTEELINQGHEVTLFASGDSYTSAELVPCCARALRLSNVKDPLPYSLLQLDLVFRRAHEFDVLHFHNDCLHFPLMRNFAHKSVTTLHGRLDLPDLAPLFKQFNKMPVVSISSDQRRPLAANWVATVYHGLPRNLYSIKNQDEGDYLAFLGRICPDKGIVRAIEIARRTGQRLKIAAKVDKVDQCYFDETVSPLLAAPNVEFIGEIGENEKEAFLNGAKALIFPIEWPEPFGLVMIEAMACGTPVIAFPHGSVREVIDDGVSGFIVESVDEAAAAVAKVDNLDRRLVRKTFEHKFTSELMARNYIKVYERLLKRPNSSLGKAKPAPNLSLIEPFDRYRQPSRPGAE